MAKPANNSTLMEKIAAFIVDKRTVFFLLYIFALVFSLFSMNWVNVENDVTKYLPEETETRQGITVMNENFAAFGTAQILVSSVTCDTAQTLADAIAEVEGVDMVVFDDSEEHFRDTNALIAVTFKGSNMDPVSISAMAEIEEILADFDTYVDTLVGYDENAMLDQEMTAILIVAVIIIAIVLVLTSRSYAEVPVLALTFGAAALINMGTNFLCGTISFISDSIAVLMQLALAIDYAIILCHRFVDEHESKDARTAAISSLSKAIPEIGASSLTTISGLLALSFMKFSIGMDMAVVLIKSVLISMLAVFTLMPGLLVLFCPLMDKTRHKKLLPNITPIGKFAVKTRRVVPPLFVAVLIGAFVLSNNAPYAFSYNHLKTTKMTDQQTAYFKILDTFGESNMVAVVVPSGDYEAEAAVLSELSRYPEVKSTIGLSGIEIMEGRTLTDSLTPRELSELIGLDYEVAELLYTIYAAEHNQFGPIVTNIEEYRIPLFDTVIYIKDKMASHNITLEGEDLAMISDLFSQLESAQAQLQSERYSRMVVNLNLPEEGQETYDFLQTIRTVLGKYYDGDYYVVGNSTSARDLSAFFDTDNLMITILSALFVILVLLFTFQSVGMPLLLIAVIQGSIWINFSFPTLTQTPLYFLGCLIVQSIQMGANIDYAIVISSHYQEMKQLMPHKKAIVHALNSAFPTVFTSGTIMASAGLLIGAMSAQPAVSIMCTTLGRGTVVSIVLVLFILPAVLVLGDSLIEHTRFAFRHTVPQTKQVRGAVRVQGHVKGYISGIIDANIDGLLQGEMDANVSIDTEISQEGGEDNA